MKRPIIRSLFSHYFTQRPTQGGAPTFTGQKLPATLEIVPEASGHVVLPAGQSSQGPIIQTTSTDDVLKNLADGLQATCKSGPDVTPDLLDNHEQVCGVWQIRFGADPDQAAVEKPDNADTMGPAVQAIFDSVGLLNAEDLTVLREEDLAKQQAAVQASENNQRVLDNVAPLVRGAQLSLNASQAETAAFCKRVAKNAAPAMSRSFLLSQKLSALTEWIDSSATSRAETTQLVAKVSHEVEAATLARVKETLGQGGAAAGTAGGTTGQGSGQTAGQTSGQTAQPPASAPVTLPAPVHGKPKRKTHGASAGKPGKKSGPATPSTPSTPSTK